MNPEIERLSRITRTAAATTPDVPRQLAVTIKAAAAGPADPWLVIGLLIEGIAYAVDVAIPAQRQGHYRVASLRLLADRLGDASGRQ
jgi:hypothetical protein